MQRRTKEMINKVKQILLEEEYIRSTKLAKMCKLCVGSICRIVRVMREQGIGVHTTKQGYTLSEYAKVRDDVGFLRRLHARRASDFVALQAAKPHIQRRWSSVKQQRELRAIAAPLSVNVGALSRGMRVIVQKSEKLGI